MRNLVLIAVLCAVAGCAGQPTAPKEETKVAGKKVIPERVKGPYKVVMKGDKKLYCTKELSTGSKTNFRTICMTPEEYADMERQAQEGMRALRGPNTPSGPAGLGPGQNPAMP
jgi:hypothetical protein